MRKYGVKELVAEGNMKCRCKIQLYLGRMSNSNMDEQQVAAVGRPYFRKERKGFPTMKINVQRRTRSGHGSWNLLTYKPSKILCYVFKAPETVTKTYGSILLNMESNRRRDGNLTTSRRLWYHLSPQTSLNAGTHPRKEILRIFFYRKPQKSTFAVESGSTVSDPTYEKRLVRRYVAKLTYQKGDAEDYSVRGEAKRLGSFSPSQKSACAPLRIHPTK